MEEQLGEAGGLATNEEVRWGRLGGDNDGLWPECLKTIGLVSGWTGLLRGI